MQFVNGVGSGFPYRINKKHSQNRKEQNISSTLMSAGKHGSRPGRNDQRCNHRGSKRRQSSGDGCVLSVQQTGMLCDDTINYRGILQPFIGSDVTIGRVHSLVCREFIVGKILIPSREMGNVYDAVHVRDTELFWDCEYAFYQSVIGEIYAQRDDAGWNVQG
jgi:hypothetical protein